MLNQRTVFVIGAGAGFDLHMPLGAELSTAIADAVNFHYEAGALREGNEPIERALKHIARARGMKPQDLTRAGRMISGGIRHTRSIDNYIHAHSDKEAVKIVAKTAIVHTIIQAEKESHLYFDEHQWPPRFKEEAKVHESWLSDFFRLLNEGIVESKNLDQIFDKLTIINFNYDRCVEHYLLHATQQLYPTKGEELANLCRKLPILHPYGTIGSLPWQSKPDSVAFGGDLSDQQLATLSEQIRTFNEQIEDETKLDEIRSHISNAETIVFLGFHFHPQNMEVLTSDTAISPSQTPATVYATQVGRSIPDLVKIRQKIALMLAGRAITGQSSYKAEYGCKKFFKDYASALSP